MKILRCLFLHNRVENSLIKLYDSNPTIKNCQFTSTTGRIFELLEARGATIEKISVVGTTCNRGSGCFLEISGRALFQPNMGLSLNNVTIVNMTMSPESSAINLNSVIKFSIQNVRLSNVSGSVQGACLAVANSQDGFFQSTIANFVAENISSGCIDLQSSTNIVISNFSVNNLNLRKLDRQKLPDSAIRISNCFKIYLLNGELRNNEAQLGGAIFIKKATGQINNVSFFNNTAMQGGGLYAEDSHLQFSNLTFTDNYANLAGGGAYFEQMKSLTLNNITFRNNKGLERNSSLIANSSKGGAIYYSCEQENNPCKPNIEGYLVVTNNSADIGGGVYYDKRIFYPSVGSIFSQNSAARYGPNFASSPIQILYSKDMENVTNTLIQIFDEKKEISRDHLIRTYFIDPNNWTNYQQWEPFVNNTEKIKTLPITVNITYFDQRGGSPLLRGLSIYALDHFGQQINGDNGTYYLQIEPTRSKSHTSNNTFRVSSTNGLFRFADKFTSSPGESIDLTIQSNIQCLLFNSTNTNVKINFRLCDAGEINPYGSEICSSCPPNSYSLTKAVNSNTICLSCRNVTGLLCEEGGNKLTVLPGYWRYNEESLNVIRCFNPAACSPKIPNTPEFNDCSNVYRELLEPDFLKKTCESMEDGHRIDYQYGSCTAGAREEIRNYCVKLRHGTTTGSCNEGYKDGGVLCTECTEGWGKSKNYNVRNVMRHSHSLLSCSFSF